MRPSFANCNQIPRKKLEQEEIQLQLQVRFLSHHVVKVLLRLPSAFTRPFPFQLDEAEAEHRLALAELQQTLAQQVPI